jgi:fatty acid desaturase
MTETHASESGRRRNPYQPYRQTLLTAQEVGEFSRLRPARVVRDTLVCWLFILAAWWAVAVWTQWWVVLLAIPVIGNRYYALFIIGHDGLHRRLMNSRRRNDLFCDLFVFGAIGAITRINNRNHLRHHLHLANEGDPDRHRYACFNKSTRWEYLFFYSGLANLLPAAMNVFAKRSGESVTNESRSYSWRDFAILAGWQLALIGGLTWAIGWWAYPVLWLIPVYLFTYCADLVRTFLEHSHPEADEVADEHRLITYSSHPLERMVLAPMNMNYHVVHHLWTSIPYYRLPAANRAIRDREAASGLIWRRSYLGYAFEYLFALPLPECRRHKAESTP